jgi:F-type H+-transporting ATPase subunit gamma
MFGSMLKTVAQPTAGIAGVRNMATLKEIALRLKSITSIRKITKSMKMVSAAKFARAERALKAGAANGPASIALLEKTGLELPETDKQLLVVISSDRGLCGGVHSGIGRYIRAKTANQTGVDNELVVVGDKCRGILARTHQDSFLVTANAYGRMPPQFVEASHVAQMVLNSGSEYTSGKIIYNHFKSAMAYEVTERPIFSGAAIEDKEALFSYDDIDSGKLQSYAEFSLATNMYYAMLQNLASEQSARMAAMDNASNNASDMIKTLSQKYNRTRQAVITTELIEIISGASAMAS